MLKPLIAIVADTIAVVRFAKKVINLKAINIFTASTIRSILSLKNFKVFAVALIATLNPLPIRFPNSAISSLFASTVYFRSPKFSFNAPKKPLETST